MEYEDEKKFVSKMVKKRNTVRVERRLNLIIIILTALSLAVVVLSLFRGGLSGLSTEADQRRIRQEDEFVKQNLIWGSILDRNGVVICEATEKGVDTTCKQEMFGLLVGYDSSFFGSYGLKRAFQYDLEHGHDVKLTIDCRLQEAAYEAIGNEVGCCIILDNKTGCILAFASRELVPLDATNLTIESMNEYNGYDDFWYLNGVTERDPPGSVFKIITSAAAYEAGVAGDIYYDTGKYRLSDGAVIKNSGEGAYGNIGIEMAFKCSINAYFVHLAVDLIGKEQLEQTMKAFGFGEVVELDFGYTLKSGYDLDSEYELAATAFGQGKTTITPLELAMIGQTIASDGIRRKPYMIECVNAKAASKPEVLGEACSKEVAKKLKALMAEAAKLYGLSLPDNGYVGAKTGTAEVEGGNLNHTYLLTITDKYSVILSRNRTEQTSGFLKKPMQHLLERVYETEDE